MVTACRPGALGKIPRLPCEPTTCVLGSSLEGSVSTIGTVGNVSALDQRGGLLSGWLNGGVDSDA